MSQETSKNLYEGIWIDKADEKALWKSYLIT